MLKLHRLNSNFILDLDRTITKYSSTTSLEQARGSYLLDLRKTVDRLFKAADRTECGASSYRLLNYPDSLQRNFYFPVYFSRHYPARISRTSSHEDSDDSISLAGLIPRLLLETTRRRANKFAVDIARDILLDVDAKLP